MPTAQAHIEHAQHNINFLEKFIEGIEERKFNDWAITVAFYACVHIIEAIIFRKKDLTYNGQNIRIENSDELPTAASKANIPPPENLTWTMKLNHKFRNMLTSENFPDIREQYDYLYKQSRTARYRFYKYDDKDVDLILKYAPTHIIDWANKNFDLNLKVTKKILKP